MINANASNQADDSRASHQPTVGLIDWSHLIEDFLDNINVSFESFCGEMSGGWMFGYITALQRVGVRTVLFCVSSKVQTPLRRTHQPTGATICVLPASSFYKRLRGVILNPYTLALDEAAGAVRGARRVWAATAKELIQYAATPVFHLAREMQRERCEVVLCQEYEHGRFDLCLLAARLLGLRCYASFQGGNRSLGKLEAAVRPFAVREADGLVIASQHEINRVRRDYHLPADKIRMIFNPLDATVWTSPNRAEERRAARIELGITPEACVVAWHGRVIIRHKALDVLLEAWGRVCLRLKEKNINPVLLLVGTGNDADELQTMIDARGLKHSVVWINEYVRDRARLRGYLSSADVYVLASRREGFAVAPLEAMACELPVIATDVQGIRDVFNRGEESGGVIVASQNPQALADALERVACDAELRRRLAMHGARRVREAFTPEAVGAALKDFLFPH